MICESCSKETNRVITEVADVGGRKVIIKYCPECPTSTPEGQRYEKHVIKKRRGRPPKAGKMKEFALPEEEIKATQELKPSFEVVQAAKIKDVQTREVDKTSPDTERFFIGAYSSTRDFSGWRETKIAEKANGRFGYNKWRKKEVNGKVLDDGEWVTIERVG